MTRVSTGATVGPVALASWHAVLGQWHAGSTRGGAKSSAGRSGRDASDVRKPPRT